MRQDAGVGRHGSKFDTYFGFVSSGNLSACFAMLFQDVTLSQGTLGTRTPRPVRAKGLEQG
jgi:hypothetical protein